MGGILEGGVGIASKSSPNRAVIEKVQTELRKEYDVREERKRELEFLEKGGNPLDFKLGNSASVSVQSTSFTNLQPDVVTSQPKGSFAFTASLYGETVASSGRLAAVLCEPNSADNIMLFDAEHVYSEGDRNSFHPIRGNVVPPEQSLERDGSHKTREHGDSSAFGLPRKAYKRRCRSHSNRDGARSSSSDVNLALGSHGSSLPSHHAPGNVIGPLSDVENLDVSSNCNSKPGSPINGTLCPDVCVDDHRFVELNDAKAVGSTEDLIKGVSSRSYLDATSSKNPLGLNKPSFTNAAKTPTKMDCNESATMEEMAYTVVEHEPREAAGKVENHSSCQMNGFINKKSDAIKNDAHNGNAACRRNGFDSGSSYSQTNFDVDRNNDAETGTRISTIDSNGDIDSQNLGPETLVVGLKETKGAKIIDNFSVDEESASACVSHRQNGPSLQPQEEKIQGRSFLHDKLTNQFDTNGMEAGGCSGSQSGRKPIVPLVENSSPQSEMFCRVIGNSIADLSEAVSSSKISTISFNVQSPGNLKLESVDEESILKEAEIIEAKRKRIAELSTLNLTLEIPRKSHWDYVLEEMAWLANDFAQERIWKLAASSQICNRAAFSSRVRKQEKSSSMKAKIVARTLVMAVMEFWHSVEKISKELEQPSQKDGAPAVQSYMARFLKCNNSNVLHYQADVQLTLDKVSDSGVLDMSLEDSLTEENLFYAIPLGPMVTYKKSIESLVAHYERIGSDVREEVETSACDLVADDSLYEDDGYTCTFGMPVASDDGNSSKFGQKKRKYSAHAYGARAYGIGSDYLPMHISENKIVTQQSAFLAKRQGGSLNVSVPTKRMRTASRKILSPFGAGTSGCIQLPNKADASSGDTNSFQDDQSTLHDGSSFPINLEVEPGGEFEKNLAFDSAEVSTKPKKKKVKHPTSAFGQRWLIDSNFHYDQRDHSKKRSDSYQLESNDCNGVLDQPMTKKIMQPLQDGSFDNTSTVAGHVPSPLASQMSNIYHPNKFYNMLGGRERGRKAKVLEMPIGRPGSGTPWPLFEDQALVVMVHDMGPNWELVSDIFNSTMQFKCIFRNAKECKERHNILMDKTSGDGVESAEDSGSSQPYSSTLPGIPKGSARQLFQHLKEPMEEDTLRSHREKIILIGQKLRYHNTQDPKQLQPPHSSHTMALSQVCPNNMGGGSVLSPLDLCDANVSGPDIPSLGYQGTYSSGLIISNQSAGAPTHPTFGASSALQGSSNMMLGNNIPSSPGPHSSVRDGRYGAPRPASLSIDEQLRIQQYNQMVSGRNDQQSNLSSSGALPGIDRGVRVPPSGSGMGMGCISGSMPMARHGLHGVASSSSVNSGNMVSANMHHGVRSGPGNSSLRPCEGSPMMRPGLSQDSQRQAMTPDLQMQVSPGSNKVMSHFGGLSSPFTNQTVSPPVSSYPLHHQLSHQISPQQAQVPSPRHPHFQGPPNLASNPQQQAYAIRLAKERQLQQRFLQQPPPPPQQQFAASSSSIPHGQPQPHIPGSSAVQNSQLVQSPANSPSVSVSPLTSPSSINAMSQQQQKHHTPTRVVIHNVQTGGSALASQTSKQRQKQQQPFIQTNRQHPQQRQQSQSQQQAKVVEGVGRGNMMIHQNIQIDPIILNGSLMEAQESYSGSSVNAVPPTMQYTSSQLSNHPLPRQKKFSGQASSSSKHLQQMISHSDTSQGHVPPIAPAPGLLAAHQSVAPLVAASSNHPKVIPNQNFMNQNQSALQKVVQVNHQISSEATHKAHLRGSDTCQNSTSNSTEMEATTSLPKNQWHTSEPVNESNVLNSATSLESLVSKPANVSDTTLPSSQGHVQRLSSANLIPITNDVSSQWQRQQPQVQHSHSPSPSPLQQSQIQQAGNAKFFGTPSDSRLE